MAKKTSKDIMCCEGGNSCCISKLIIGIGIGALLSNLVFGLHPLKWGFSLIAVGILIYFLPKITKK
ncbi:MAG: hypothetical protein WCV81_00595 [Microgenomates group bacterium]|jgi:hypothetical protein